MSRKEKVHPAERIATIRGHLSMLREDMNPAEHSPEDYGLQGAEGSLEALSSIIGMSMGNSFRGR